MELFNQGTYGQELEAKSILNTAVMGSRIERPSITDRLKERKAYHEQELVQINSALARLEQHPEIQSVIDQLAKLNF